MLIFSKIILKLLNEYKIVLRKHLDNEAWVAKVNELGLKRKTLKHDNDTTLYYKAQKVIKDIKEQLNRDSNVPSWYSGLDEFYQHLQNVLADYQIHDSKILHTSQQASRAMVEAFQLMKIPDAKRNQVIAAKLDVCGQIIAKHGDHEQQEMFVKALKNFQHEDINFFLPLLSNFERYLQEFTEFLNGSQLDLET